MTRVLALPVAYRWLITLAFIAFISLLSLTPGTGQANDSIFAWLLSSTAKPIQKLMHVSVYATLSLLLMWTLARIKSKAVRILLTLLIAVGLGAVLEVGQMRVPGRYGTIFDILLNGAGAIAGLVIALVILQERESTE